MPAVMAGAGTSSILVLGVISLGAVLLGVLFGQLTKRVPSSRRRALRVLPPRVRRLRRLSDGLVLLDHALGRATPRSSSSWVLYVESLFGIEQPGAWTNFGIAMCGLWIPAAINLVGVRQMAWFQNVTVVLKFLPLLVVGVVGWFFVKSANFGPFNASGGSLYSAHRHRGRRRAVLVHRRRMRVHRGRAGEGSAPQRRARLGARNRRQRAALHRRHRSGDGTGLPRKRSNGNGAPFVDAFQTMFGHAAWVGKLVAGAAVVSGIGALNGWTHGDRGDALGRGEGRPVRRRSSLRPIATGSRGSASWSPRPSRQC